MEQRANARHKIVIESLNSIVDEQCADMIGQSAAQCYSHLRYVSVVYASDLISSSS